VHPQWLARVATFGNAFAFSRFVYVARIISVSFSLGANSNVRIRVNRSGEAIQRRSV
jgi:hypothetical protein